MYHSSEKSATIASLLTQQVDGYARVKLTFSEHDLLKTVLRALATDQSTDDKIFIAISASDMINDMMSAMVGSGPFKRNGNEHFLLTAEKLRTMIEGHATSIIGHDNEDNIHALVRYDVARRLGHFWQFVREIDLEKQVRRDVAREFGCEGWDSRGEHFEVEVQRKTESIRGAQDGLVTRLIQLF